MNKQIKTLLSIAIVATAMFSCQPRTQDGQTTSTGPKDTVASQALKPAESGYADVNGLKMYYEVYGQGKPIVLLHGIGSSSKSWRRNHDELSKYIRVIA